MIFARPIRILPKGVHCAVCSLPETARIRIGDKSAVKERVENPVYRMVHEPVADACFVYVARLGVADFEMRVWTVSIFSGNQIRAKRGGIFYKVILKRLYVLLFLLAAQKLFPRIKQIVGRNDIVIGMRDADSVHSFERTPPPPR